MYNLIDVLSVQWINGILIRTGQTNGKRQNSENPKRLSKSKPKIDFYDFKDVRCSHSATKRNMNFELVYNQISNA